jgi:hypothetical protein
MQGFDIVVLMNMELVEDDLRNVVGFPSSYPFFSFVPLDKLRLARPVPSLSFTSGMIPFINRT